MYTHARGPHLFELRARPPKRHEVVWSPLRCGVMGLMDEVSVVSPKAGASGNQPALPSSSGVMVPGVPGICKAQARAPMTCRLLVRIRFSDGPAQPSHRVLTAHPRAASQVQACKHSPPGGRAVGARKSPHFQFSRSSTACHITTASKLHGRHQPTTANISPSQWVHGNRLVSPLSHVVGGCGIR